jgi:Raf kinase inhibitor-like YbhB/YbcL family protein
VGRARPHRNADEEIEMMRFALAAALALAATPAFALTLTSSDVADGQTFDAKFICAKQSGANISPALAWSDLPAGTQSVAFTMYDSDANVWHWLAVDIPAATTSLAQGAASANGQLPAGAMNLKNVRGNTAYDGPCPPAGKPHHYHITVYALPDAKAPVTDDMKPADAGAALKAAALGTAEITPTYPK